MSACGELAPAFMESRGTFSRTWIALSCSGQFGREPVEAPIRDKDFTHNGTMTVKTRNVTANKYRAPVPSAADLTNLPTIGVG